MVHRLLYPTTDGRVIACGMPIVAAVLKRDGAVTLGRWQCLPASCQCAACGDFPAHRSATASEAISSCLGAAAFHSTASGPLLAAALAGDMEAAAVLVDAILVRGVYEVDWPVIDEHEHTWLPWTTGDELRIVRYGAIAVTARRCTCGVFEHEVSEGAGPWLWE